MGKLKKILERKIPSLVLSNSGFMYKFVWLLTIFDNLHNNVLFPIFFSDMSAIAFFASSLVSKRTKL